MYKENDLYKTTKGKKIRGNRRKRSRRSIQVIPILRHFGGPKFLLDMYDV